MKFCYVDESGTGDEPFAVMVGVIVDALRMRPTKADWDTLLARLSILTKRDIKEVHTRDFYAGNGPWRDLAGATRTQIIGEILDWISERKHWLIVAAVDKQAWHKDFPADSRYSDLNTLWRFLGLHLVLGIQKLQQPVSKQKGNTVLIFDNEERERTRFTDLVLNPPPWTDSYYLRKKKKDPLDQIIDAPYFADSQDVPLLQVADFVAYFLRRYAELQNGDAERYLGERAKILAWVTKILARRVSRSAMYPKSGRCACTDMFFRYAPPCLR